MYAVEPHATGSIRSQSSSDLRRILQSFLSFEVVAFMQAGLLAFDPVGGLLNHSVQLVGIADEEAVGGGATGTQRTQHFIYRPIWFCTFLSSVCLRLR